MHCLLAITPVARFDRFGHVHNMPTEIEQYTGLPLLTIERYAVNRAGWRVQPLPRRTRKVTQVNAHYLPKQYGTVIYSSHVLVYRRRQRSSTGPGAVVAPCQDDGTRGGRRRRRTKTTTAAGTRGRRRRRRRRCGTYLQLSEMQCSIHR